MRALLKEKNVHIVSLPAPAKGEDKTRPGTETPGESPVSTVQESEKRAANKLQLARILAADGQPAQRWVTL